MRFYKEKALLQEYRTYWDNQLIKAIEEEGENSSLKEACLYAVTSGGKRLRPILVQIIAEALDNHSPILEAALATEFFHTASLIADDLPCMDNEQKRRGKLTLHYAYDESVAILASYTFLSLGYEFIQKNTRSLQKSSSLFSEKAYEIGCLCLDQVTGSSGILGATYGQFLDLFPPDISLKTAYKVVEKKTVTLFEISFVLGWLFGGGEKSKLEKVRKAAYHFGMAFQIEDDLQDQKEDKACLNMARLLGEKKAVEEREKNKEKMTDLLKELSLYTEKFQALISFLLEKDNERLTSGAV